MSKNRNFGQKSKFWAKIEILGKNRNIGQKIKILRKNRNFGQKIKILGKNRIFGHKSKFWAQIEILGKNRNFGQKSKFWAQIEIVILFFSRKWKAKVIGASLVLFSIGCFCFTLPHVLSEAYIPIKSTECKTSTCEAKLHRSKSKFRNSTKISIFYPNLNFSQKFRFFNQN